MVQSGVHLVSLKQVEYYLSVHSSSYTVDIIRPALVFRSESVREEN